MDNTRNALSELAEQLKAVLPYVAVECGVCEIDKHLTSKRAKDFIVASQRIIAELAKIEEAEEFLIEKYDVETARRIVHQLKGNTILKCRAIAEEGGAK